MKIDKGDVFLCTDVDSMEEVFLLMDKGMASFVVRRILLFKKYIREDGGLMVKVAKAMYGLIQSALLYDIKSRLPRGAWG